MTKVGMVFAAGLTGVFICMGVLYAAIRLTSLAVDRFSRRPGVTTGEGKGS